MALSDGHVALGHQWSGFIKRILPKDIYIALMNKKILSTIKKRKRYII